MRFSTWCMTSVSITARLNPATRSSVARQSAMVLKLSTNQRNEDWTCMKAPEASMRPPNVRFPAKYNGAATRIGATSVNQPEPAVIQVRLVSPVTRRAWPRARSSGPARCDALHPARRRLSAMASMCSLTRTNEKRRSASRA